MRFISLFSGIGGLDLGLERAGLQCVGQVEIDDYATRVLEKHWPTVPRWRDVRSVGHHNLPYTDAIVGGFPCQDISNAGRRVGIDGDRSGLWSEYYRIICELRPRYVLVENVSALFVRGMGRVLGDLASVGYDTEWECIPAAALGAPHIRDRVFIVAYPHDPRRGRWQQRQAITAAERLANADRARLEIGPCFGLNALEALAAVERRGGARGGVWTVEPDVDRVAYGVPNRMDRLRGLGNAVVPQVAEYIGRLIVSHAEQGGAIHGHQ